MAFINIVIHSYMCANANFLKTIFWWLIKVPEDQTKHYQVSNLTLTRLACMVWVVQRNESRAPISDSQKERAKKNTTCILEDTGLSSILPNQARRAVSKQQLVRTNKVITESATPQLLLKNGGGIVFKCHMGWRQDAHDGLRCWKLLIHIFSIFKDHW